MANEKWLIAVDDLKRAIWNADCDVYEFCEGCVTNMGISRLALDDVIDGVPTVDAVEVVHGRWKYYHKQNIAVCTNCSFERNLDENFGKAVSCPNCGAKMDGGNEGGV